MLVNWSKKVLHLGQLELVHYEPSHVVKAEKEQSRDYCLHTESYESTDYSDGSDEYQLIVRNATDRRYGISDISRVSWID